MNKKEGSDYLNQFFMEVYSYRNKLVLKLEEHNVTKEEDFLKSKGNRFKSIDEFNAYTDGYLESRDEII